MINRYSGSRWGALRTLRVPSFIFRQGSLRVSASALSVYLCLLLLHRRRMMYLRKEPWRKGPTVIASRERLSLFTGYKETQLDKAIRQLKAAGLIHAEPRRRRDRESGTLRGSQASEYVFLKADYNDSVSKMWRGYQNPPMEMKEDEVNLAVASKVPFFYVPEVFVAMYEQSWSLANLKPKDTPIYVALLWQAMLNRSNTIDVVASKLRRIAAVKDPRTLTAALNRLESLGLLTRGESEEADFSVTLCDPTTGEPVRLIEDTKADPANYRIGSKLFVLNQGTEEDREKLLLSFLPPYAPTIKQGNGDLTIPCPYHDDTNPSCSVSFRLRCFQCFACEAKGTYSEVLLKLKGGDGKAVMSQVAARRDEKVTFHDPEKDVLAIYEYKGADGELLKQVLRLTNDAKGRKRFRQRHPGKYGWIRNARGVPKTLYHWELLKDADVVVVTEGEKDADAVTSAGLRSATSKSVVGWDLGKPVVALASGNADSWRPEFAELLRDKRVS